MRPFLSILIFDIESSADHVECLLGRGTYGTVIRAKDVITETVVAIKVLHKAGYYGVRDRTEEKAYMRLVGGCNTRIRSVECDESLICVVFTKH